MIGVTYVTVEKELKGYKSFKIVKVTDNSGLPNESILYVAYDVDDNLFDASGSLKGLKCKIDRYLS